MPLFEDRRDPRATLRSARDRRFAAANVAFFGRAGDERAASEKTSASTTIMIWPFSAMRPVKLGGRITCNVVGGRV